jgi:hypothetical protein
MGHFEMYEGSAEDTALNTKTQSTQRRGISSCTLCLGVYAVSNGKTAVFKLTRYQLAAQLDNAREPVASCLAKTRLARRRFTAAAATVPIPFDAMASR